MLEKGWNSRIPHYTFKQELVDIHPTASSLKFMLDKERHHANRCMQDSFKYAKVRWDKIHKPPDFIVVDFFLVSTLNFNTIKGQRKLKDSFSGPFMIKALHGPNAVQIELTGESMNKHPTFPPPLEITPLEGEEKKTVKVLKERKTRTKREREYLVRYRNPAEENEWLLEEDTTNHYKLLRRFRNERRPKG
ncbi:hypothetical protein O181_009202 [Austropuccinia psidii MF-1]|uniref:Chromo domain-containing protein n=1 Tax=Austropuccinia psidii MF-1 TaxID=1389203 RepID=A0A9Q3BR97_9BASI|nr:hypothetical protein [Austropuccinia psidii MF-1]